MQNSPKERLYVHFNRQLKTKDWCKTCCILLATRIQNLRPVGSNSPLETKHSLSFQSSPKEKGGCYEV